MSSGGAGFSASRLVGSAAEFSVISLLFLASIYIAYQVRHFSSRAMQCFGLNRMPLRGRHCAVLSVALNSLGRRIS
jgi:hypothetical protein